MSRFGTWDFGASTFFNKRDATSSQAGRDAYRNWLISQGILTEAGLKYNSFSGVDIKAAIWIPPHRGNATGSFKTWAELQTLTVSSERPPGPARVLGSAAPRGYVRGVRTIAGSMIFTVLDRDVFAETYQRYEGENPEEYPAFVDQIPPFHVIIDATNEIGFAAGSAIIGVVLSNFGTTYSVDDLMLEATYTYVAQYVHPFVNMEKWRSELASEVSKIEAMNASAASRLYKEQWGIEDPQAIANLDDDGWGDQPFTNFSI
jgi:hypothetical protein